MSERIAIPKRGDGISAAWGASVANAINALGACGTARTLVRDGVFGQGFEAIPDNLRARRAASNTPDVTFLLRTGREKRPNSNTAQYRSYIDMYCTSCGAAYLQGTSATAGEAKGGLNPGDGCDLASDGWQRIHQTEYGATAPAIEKTIYLEIDATDEDAPVWNVTDGENAGGGETSGDGQSGRTGRWAIGEVCDGRVLQAMVGAQDFSIKEEGSEDDPSRDDQLEPDGDSIDANGGESGDKLQIAHFNDTERDSGKGLAPRLKVNLETGEVTSEGYEELMILCRKNGKLIYIPLGGNGEDPDLDDEENKEDACEHPGGEAGGGVDIGGGDGGGGGGGGGGGSGGGGGGDGDGGVDLDGDTHPGNPCQEC